MFSLYVLTQFTSEALCVAIYKEQDAGVGFKASKLGLQEI